MKLEYANAVCPKCGSGNYMRYLLKDDGTFASEYAMKCINCNSYFKLGEVRERPIKEKKMVEYIDREKAYPLAKKICDAIDSDDFQRLNFGMRILDWIDDIPAADARPVVKAKWYLGDDMLLHCSNCEQIPHNRVVMNNVCIFDLTPIKSLMKYCPNCGARMEES